MGTKGIEIVGKDVNKIVEMLNKALADEWLAYYQYWVGAKVVKGRRPSTISIAQNLRTFLKSWRESDYAGASDTTRELLYHWFEQDHIVETPNGEPLPFRYYFCQRESIETLIYLFEVRGIKNLSAAIAEFGGEDRETAALGVNPDDDQWAKYAFKVATGAGKTKIMSLTVVWSYFHALRESDSPMTKHFVVIAPNLTVFERLKEDFGNGIIFDKDPLIPVNRMQEVVDLYMNGGDPAQPLASPFDSNQFS